MEIGAKLSAVVSDSPDSVGFVLQVLGAESVRADRQLPDAALKFDFVESTGAAVKIDVVLVVHFETASYLQIGKTEAAVVQKHVIVPIFAAVVVHSKFAVALELQWFQLECLLTCFHSVLIAAVVHLMAAQFSNFVDFAADYKSLLLLQKILLFSAQ